MTIMQEASVPPPGTTYSAETVLQQAGHGLRKTPGGKMTEAERTFIWTWLDYDVDNSPEFVDRASPP
jgi:hypothetical protein